MALDSILALVSVAGEILVLAFLLRNKAWRTLPFFCIFMLSALATEIASSLILSRPTESYRTYYLNQLIADSILQFLVLVELAWSTLRPVRKSLPRGTLYIVALLIAVAGAIIWPLVGTTVPHGFGPKSTLLFHLQTTPAILRVGFFLVLAGGSQLLSIGWRDRELQVATGLGFFSIVSLMAAVMHTHGGTPEQYHFFDEAATVSYLFSLTYWVFSFSTKEQERKEFSPQMQQLLLQMGGGIRSNRVTLTHIPPARSRKKD